MSNFVEWIAAEANGEPAKRLVHLPVRRESCVVNESEQKVSAHNFPPWESRAQMGNRSEDNWQGDPDIWLYRKKTTALLRRYMRWSLEAGRVPSLLGRELFRSKISVFTATTFEARVIFLHDIERCLDRLQGFDRQLIARVVLQEYDHEAAARMLRCTRRTLERRLPELLDELSDNLLRADLLERFPEITENRHE
jgi:hypothetical protein